MSIIYEAIRCRLPMKRLLILFLLVLMPLQIVWAASGACCGADDDAASRHVCHQWQQQCDEDDAATAADEGCDCCHHFSGSALAALRPDPMEAGRVPQAAFDPPHYTSHIPDLVPPPDRSYRA